MLVLDSPDRSIDTSGGATRTCVEATPAPAPWIATTGWAPCRDSASLRGRIRTTTLMVDVEAAAPEIEAAEGVTRPVEAPAPPPWPLPPAEDVAEGGAGAGAGAGKEGGAGARAGKESPGSGARRSAGDGVGDGWRGWCAWGGRGERVRGDPGADRQAY